MSLCYVCVYGCLYVNVFVLINVDNSDQNENEK